MKKKSVLWIFLKRNILIPGLWVVGFGLLFVAIPVSVGRILGGEIKDSTMPLAPFTHGAMYWIFGLLCIAGILLIISIFMALIGKIIEIKEWFSYKWNEAKREANSN